jgi:hypothetical protein
LPGPKSRYLLPYERRLVAWQLRRWRAGRRYDVAKTEQRDGAESVRPFAACLAGFQLAKVIGFLAAAVGLGAAAILGAGGLLVGAGVLAVDVLVVITAVAREWQSEAARKEYQQTRPFTPK